MLDDSLAGFDEFAETVKAFLEGDLWLVESTGLPSHNMMVGITSWQQQVALPQPYSGNNAWRLPANPALSDTPISARNALFTGAIALAVNGVPIFNALNNRGDDAYLAGELDEWGGHAGRADDYHYHVAPLHLQEVVGAAKPIAYALDGFPIFGEREPGGTAVGDLDEYNGHTDSAGDYHYHGTETYPYINGGLRGVVEVIDDQVQPQPRLEPIRPAGEPLRGAVITAFESALTGAYRLEYVLGSDVHQVEYEVQNDVVRFVFTDADGITLNETYAR